MTDEKIIARMQADQEQGWPLCPRCGERMPDKLTHGALMSRWELLFGHCQFAYKHEGEAVLWQTGYSRMWSTR